MNEKNLFIRVDSGTKIGAGHIMRCFAIAEALKNYNIEPSFISRHFSGDLSDFIESKGYKVYRLPNNAPNHEDHNETRLESMNELDAEQTIEIINKNGKHCDCLLVDNYNLDKKWEKKLRPHVKKIIVIDDLANRPHDCDLLIDQNLYEQFESRYDNLVSSNCQKLLGPRYALLRNEFREARKNLRKREWPIKNILISFGGSDPTNETCKVLDAMCLIDPFPQKIDIVIGPSNQNKEIIEKKCSSLQNTTSNYNVDNISSFMVNADLSIGAGGSTTWERCCLGLPTIVSTLSIDQIELTNAVHKRGCIINIGFANDLSPKDYAEAIKSINPEKFYRMSQESFNLVDGEGIIRVISKIQHICFQDDNTL
jgi:UDP-2,4-diacetamido-2,4,6-trideoxy-beta-L-altropyranose hydrolase